MYRKDGTVKSHRVQITNTYLATLAWIVTTTGVGIVQKRTLALRSPNHKPCGSWQTYGEKGRQFLRQVLPYLQIKRQKAEEVLKCEYL